MSPTRQALGAVDCVRSLARSLVVSDFARTISRYSSDRSSHLLQRNSDGWLIARRSRAQQPNSEIIIILPNRAAINCVLCCWPLIIGRCNTICGGLRRAGGRASCNCHTHTLIPVDFYSTYLLHFRPRLETKLFDHTHTQFVFWWDSNRCCRHSSHVNS